MSVMRSTSAFLLLLFASAGLAMAQVASSEARHLQVLAEVGVDSTNALSLTGGGGTLLFRPAPILTPDDGSRRLRYETEQPIGRRLGVVYAGELKAAPFVRTPIDRRFPLDGPMPLAEAEAVAADLNARIGAADPDS